MLVDVEVVFSITFFNTFTCYFSVISFTISGLFCNFLYYNLTSLTREETSSIL
jgi:hypothetical protein